MEGLDKPKRKRGRPPKASTNEIERSETEQIIESGIKHKSEEEVDEELEVDADGRRRRKRKVPSRLQEALQVLGLIYCQAIVNLF